MGQDLWSEVDDYITVNNVLPGYTRTSRLDSLLSAQASTSGRSGDEIAQGILASVPARRFGEACGAGRRHCKKYDP